MIGRIGRPFGIRGEVRISPFTETIEAFERSCVLILEETPYNVLRIRGQKSAMIVALEGIDTPEQARELTGCLVKTYEENLPPKEEDEYYWFELIGMKVSTVDGRDLGRISTIIATGANDVLHVDGDYGEVLLPMIEDVVIEVDTDVKEMIVDPLEGLIPDA